MRALANLGLSDRVVPAERIGEADLILAPPSEPGDESQRAALSAGGALVLEVAPHQFDEAFALYREIGAALGEPERGRDTAARLGDPLARISAAQLGKRRPLVAALVSLVPLELAGGHSFMSDLIEVAGAESLTHANEVPRLPARVDEIRAASPELVVVALTPLPDRAARATVESWFAPTPVAFLALEPEALWLDGALDAATELAQRIETQIRRARDGSERASGADR